MLFHMKTTLIIPDPVFRELKKRAVDRNTTISELATEYLRRGLRERPRPKRMPRLPSFSAGPPLIDITSHDEIYRALDLDRLRLYRDFNQPQKKDCIESMNQCAAESIFQVTRSPD